MKTKTFERVIAIIFATASIALGIVIYANIGL